MALTGITDWVSDGKSVVRLSNGHSLLGDITGSGCMVRRFLFSGETKLKSSLRLVLRSPLFAVQ